MELRQLKYFLAVAEELNFARAAERLHMTQPPLTVAIRKLEEELGVKLFERTTRRVQLTEAGERFRERAEKIVLDVAAAKQDAADASDGRVGRLRVGFVSSASYSLLPHGVRQFRADHPRVELELVPAASGEQVEALLEGRLDVGILRDPERVPGLELTPLVQESLVAVLPADHPLAASREIAPAELARFPLVLFSYPLMPGYVGRVLEAFEGGPRLNVVQQAVHQETVLGLVAAGVGCSVLPVSVGDALLPGVVVRPLSGAPLTRLVAARGAKGSALGLRFIEALTAS
jgi:DNA-binding transcriptional LysR family regulator